MEKIKEFMMVVGNDPRLGANHISLFTALVTLASLQGNDKTVYIFRNELSPLCKLNGSTTYHKVIKELHEFGYIDYTPSYNHFVGSMVRLK